MDALTQIRDLRPLPVSGTGARQVLFGEEKIAKPQAPRANVGATEATTTPSAILGNWSRLFQANLPANMYIRIRQLARYDNGWRGHGSKALSAEALKVFLNFWIKASVEAAEPDIALTAHGTLQAEWFRNSRRHLDLEFVDSNEIFFGLFNGRNINEGVDSPVELLEWLRNHRAKPLRWPRT
jgi:hypothetical protein